nr:thylakoid membrane protein terc, chloroplastic [Quercus suber]
MGLASVIHPGMPRVSLSPKWTRLQFSHRHILTISTTTVGHNCRRAEYFPIACSRGTEQEDNLSISESKRIGSQSYDDIVNTETSDTSSSASHLETTQAHEYTSSVRTVALCVCTAVAFGIGLGLKDGVGKASEFFAGYILEQSLSVDNLFVFVLIFKYFKVPIMYQLFTSEEGDSDLSDNFVVKTCQRFIPVTSSYVDNHFITRQGGVWKATPLLLTVAVIELSDIVFAVDSIPAVFGVTRDPFIVFTSNLFAILGLRSLYTLISEGMSDLEYLQPSIGIVLGFIGCKMILDFFGFHVSTEASLGVVATCLSGGVLLSLVKKSD